MKKNNKLTLAIAALGLGLFMSPNVANADQVNASSANSSVKSHHKLIQLNQTQSVLQ